jgi:hypothetical protein
MSRKQNISEQVSISGPDDSSRGKWNISLLRRAVGRRQPQAVLPVMQWRQLSWLLLRETCYCWGLATLQHWLLSRDYHAWPAMSICGEPDKGRSWFHLTKQSHVYKKNNFNAPPLKHRNAGIEILTECYLFQYIAMHTATFLNAVTSLGFFDP